MTQTTDAVTHSVLVPLSPSKAFELFVDRFDSWWPRERPSSTRRAGSCWRGTSTRNSISTRTPRRRPRSR